MEQVRDGVLSVEARGMEKFGHLPRIPYLVAKLDRPGVLDECLLQFSSAPVEQHNRSSVELFDGGGRFNADVRAFKETGQMTRQLAFRFASIRDMPMDDKVADRPHAIGSRIGTLARGSHWPWDSASMRLPETLLDKETLVDKHGGSLQKLWG
jgi:hypothetical protein